MSGQRLGRFIGGIPPIMILLLLFAAACSPAPAIRTSPSSTRTASTQPVPSNTVPTTPSLLPTLMPTATYGADTASPVPLVTEGTPPFSNQVRAQGSSLSDVIFTIPIGDHGIHYADVGVPDALAWGPAAFTVASDGSFWIIDTAGNRVLHYDPNGILLGKIVLNGLVVGGTGIQVAKSGVLILDQASMPPKVVQFQPGRKTPR